MREAPGLRREPPLVGRLLLVAGECARPWPARRDRRQCIGMCVCVCVVKNGGSLVSWSGRGYSGRVPFALTPLSQSATRRPFERLSFLIFLLARCARFLLARRICVLYIVSCLVLPLPIRESYRSRRRESETASEFSHAHKQTSHTRRYIGAI